MTVTAKITIAKAGELLKIKAQTDTIIIDVSSTSIKDATSGGIDQLLHAAINEIFSADIESQNASVQA